MSTFNRVGSEMGAGTAITSGGLGVEAAKNVQSIQPVDIMLIDWIFWTPNYVLHTGGVIAIAGLLVIFHGWNRGRKEKKKREDRERNE